MILIETDKTNNIVHWDKEIEISFETFRYWLSFTGIDANKWKDKNVKIVIKNN